MKTRKSLPASIAASGRSRPDAADERRRRARNALAFALTAAVCLVCVEPPALAQGREARTGLALELQTSCEAMRDAWCKGRYGFRLRESGDWTAGPGPDGNVVAGRATADEVVELKRLGSEVASKAGASCDARPLRVPGVRETVTVTKGAGERVLRGMAGGLQSDCGADGSAEARLFAFADRMMEKYYPEVFP